MFTLHVHLTATKTPCANECSCAAHDIGATIELAEPPVDTIVKSGIDAAEKLRESEQTLVQRAQTAVAASRSQLAEFAAALREESGMSFRGGDFKEMAQLANIRRRRTARAAVQVPFCHCPPGSTVSAFHAAENPRVLYTDLMACWMVCHPSSRDSRSAYSSIPTYIVGIYRFRNAVCIEVFAWHKYSLGQWI